LLKTDEVEVEGDEEVLLEDEKEEMGAGSPMPKTVLKLGGGNDSVSPLSNEGDLKGDTVIFDPFDEKTPDDALLAIGLRPTARSGEAVAEPELVAVSKDMDLVSRGLEKLSCICGEEEGMGGNSDIFISEDELEPRYEALGVGMKSP
jgi:hypothetical protein